VKRKTDLLVIVISLEFYSSSCSLNIFTVLSFYFIARLFEPSRSCNEPCHKTTLC